MCILPKSYDFFFFLRLRVYENGECKSGFTWIFPAKSNPLEQSEQVNCMSKNKIL